MWYNTGAMKKSTAYEFVTEWTMEDGTPCWVIYRTRKEAAAKLREIAAEAYAKGHYGLQIVEKWTPAQAVGAR